MSRDRLVILDFYAQWCGSCKALYPKLAKLSEEHPEILVLKVNFDDNKTMCKALDVKVRLMLFSWRPAAQHVEHLLFGFC